MEHNEFKDQLYEVLDENDVALGIEDIDTSDAANIFTIKTRDGSVFEIETAAYAELYELENILVLDVGRYGFVKLQYYTPEYGFNDVITYTDSESMFEDLWQEWLDTRLYLFAK